MNAASLDRLCAKLAATHFTPPVTHVYNPLIYARSAYLDYWQRYGSAPKRFILLGMNPGPWGMAQTGVPFGEVAHVREWLRVAPFQVPPDLATHPARPVEGLTCARSEVSGRRLWGFLKERFTTPESFFRNGFVANYCPLMFLEDSGRNRTPDKLPKNEREPLLAACNEALRELLGELKPQLLIGVGKWAEQQGRAVLAEAGLGSQIALTSVPHPSPANPAANSGWGRELGALLDSLSLEP